MPHISYDYIDCGARKNSHYMYLYTNVSLVVHQRKKIDTHHCAVKLLNTGHSWSLKLCPLFGGLYYSEGLDWRKFEVGSQENVRYLEVSAIGKYPLGKFSL